MMKIHYLKTWTEFYSRMDTGDKRFELRKDDRGYREGDVLCLQEYNPETESYTGRHLWFSVTYCLRNVPQFGLNDDYVIMSVVPIDGNSVSQEQEDK